MPKCIPIVLFTVLTGALFAASDADQAYKAGQRAERAGDTLKAYLLFSRAVQLDPSNRAYAARKAALQGSTPLSRVPQLGADPADETIATALRSQGLPGTELSDAIGQAAPPPRLAGTPGNHSFDVRGDARMIFETVAGAYGIQVVFDPNYQSPPPFRFQIAGVTWQEALRALEAASDSFVAPVSSSAAIIARDTAQNRTQFAAVMSVAIPIPERISVQEAQEIVTAVQQTLEIRRITVDALRRVVFIRDEASKALAAQSMFAGLSRLRAQIEVEVEFLSVSKTSTLSYGLSLPTSASIVDFGKNIGGIVNTPSIPAAFTKFFTFGGGATFLGLGIANAAAFATLSKASGETILRSQIVALDGQAATLHVGDHYPVITGSFSDITGATATQSGTLAPTISFQDLGLVLKVTPTVHEGGEVTLDVDAQFKTLGSSSANGIPVIASRQYQGKVRLKNGEWAVVAGLVSATDTEDRDGIPGLSRFPGIGRRTHQKDSDEVLVVLKPRLLALPPWETVTPPIWTGTESRPASAF